MPEIVSACPLCGKIANRPFDQRQFRGVPIANQICAVCGFVYQSPRMTDAELEEFYAAEYRRLYQGSAGPSAKDVAVQAQRAGALVTFLQNIPQASASLRQDSMCLDIGCSAGKLMEALGRTFGCQVAGVEPGEAYRQEDRARGLEVFPSLQDLEQSGQLTFNLISLIHVLEHIPHPVEYLADLRQKWLRPDGWLLLEVPNLYCHNSFEVAHLTSFSAHTLAQAVQQAGFEIVAQKSHGKPRSHWLPLYITVLARPATTDTPIHPDQGGAHRVIIPEKNVQRKRQLGMLRRRIITRLFPSKAWIPLPEES